MILKTKSGFTLVELLLVIGIMGILMTILFQVFGSILNMKLRSEATTAVAQDGRYLLARLSYDISRATSVSIPNSTTLNLGIDGTTYSYALDGSTLELTVGAGASEQVTSVLSQINSISFEQLTDIGTKKMVRIVISIAPSIIQQGGVSGERTLTTTIATR